MGRLELKFPAPSLAAPKARKLEASRIRLKKTRLRSGAYSHSSLLEVLNRRILPSSPSRSSAFRQSTLPPGSLTALLLLPFLGALARASLMAVCILAMASHTLIANAGL